MSESLVLCEGFDDRDFLAGWFQWANAWFNLNDPPPPRFGAQSRPNSMFCLDSPSKANRIGILPVRGRPRLGPEIRRIIEDMLSMEASRYGSLVVCADVDSSVTDNADSVTDLVRQGIVSAGEHAPSGNPPWSIRDLTVEVVSMRAGTVCVANLDTQERLERVITAAFAGAFPERYAAMMAWLQQRPSATGGHGSATHWTAMAGWFADGGCSDYLRRAIWQDTGMLSHLRQVLAGTGLPKVTRRLGG